MGYNVMWHQPVGSIAVCCSSNTVMSLLIIFAAYNATLTHYAFQWARQSQKLPFPLWRSGPHLIHGSLGPPKAAPNSNNDQFSHFCRAHERDQQTYRKWDHTTPICGNRLHLATAAMRPKNKRQKYRLPLQLSVYNIHTNDHCWAYQFHLHNHNKPFRLAGKQNLAGRRTWLAGQWQQLKQQHLQWPSVARVWKYLTTQLTAAPAVLQVIWAAE